MDTSVVVVVVVFVFVFVFVEQLFILMKYTVTEAFLFRFFSKVN